MANPVAFLRPRRGLILAAFFVAWALQGPAVAQNLPTAPPYEKEIQRLAEILGAVHYLRKLCGADEAQTWRTMMQQLIDAEAPTAERRAKLVDSFNRGYRGYEQTYRACTQTAVQLIDSYMLEGADIAQRIASRYGQ